MNELIDQINAAVSFIRNKSATVPEVALVLGSGLGETTSEIEVEAEFEYGSIPHFPLSTVIGHSGKLVLGKWNGKNVVVMQGRFHYYEGYSLQQVTFPIRVMKHLGAQTIFITNASGGLNPAFKVGDLVAITDHINLNSDHPLRGKNEEQLGPRFPDQHEVYDAGLIKEATNISERNKITMHHGIYIGVTGPTFETPAEYRYMRIIGGDIVGMSTVPEVIVANHMGMRIFCISVVCDEGNPVVPQRITHQEVVEAAKSAGPKMALILKELLQKLNK